jgi:thiamine-phosphate pyrophosphorylase
MKLHISRNIQKAFSTGNRPLFYYITDRSQLSGMSLEACICRALKWGVQFIQVREKDLSDQILFEKVKRIVALAKGTKCKILVNDRADIALAAGAHGIHLPSTGFRATDLRPWLPDHFLIGKSVHTEKEIQSAYKEGADYLLLGHIFPTPSKSGLGKPVGLEFLKKVCTRFPIPIFALGGINTNRIQSILESGAVGVAGIRLFQKNAEMDALKTFKRNLKPFLNR